MKVLSTWLDMKENYPSERFRHTIAEWLKAGPPSKGGGVQYETKEVSTTPIVLKAGYCTLEAFVLKRINTTYEACRLTHIFREQKWIIEVILMTTHSQNRVFININCLGDTTKFNEIPIIRTEIIRAFIRDGWLKEDILPINSEAIMLTRECIDIVVDAINGSYRGKLPLVFVSKYFDTAGREVDVQRLAKELAGMAIVVAEQDDIYLEELKERTNKKNPFNGHIGLYYSNSTSRTYRPLGGKYGSIHAAIIKDVTKYVSAQADVEGISWEKLENERLSKQAKENEDLSNEVLIKNSTLEDQLKEAKEKLHEATKENRSLSVQNESLRQALDEKNDGRRMLLAAPINEFFVGEQHDLIVTVLKKALRTMETNTRSYELLEGIIARNGLLGKGKEVDDTLKRVLSKGENIKERDLLDLKEIGFEVISESNHYRLIYKGNDKYVITLPKTPSDFRGGKNLVSDILKTISVYK